MTCDAALDTPQGGTGYSRTDIKPRTRRHVKQIASRLDRTGRQKN